MTDDIDARPPTRTLIDPPFTGTLEEMDAALAEYRELVKGNPEYEGAIFHLEMFRELRLADLEDEAAEAAARGQS